jgi:thymidylate kinase
MRDLRALERSVTLRVPVQTNAVAGGGTSGPLQARERGTFLRGGRMASQSGNVPLVVEFVGTPGAGKTTLATGLVALLSEEGLNAVTMLGAARPHTARTLPGRTVRRLAPSQLRRPLLWQLFYWWSVTHAVRFGAAHPTLFTFVLKSQLARPITVKRKSHNLFWFFQLAGRYRFLTAMAQGPVVLVVDDGFLHRSVQLCTSHLEAPDPAKVNAYVALLPKPDLTVHVLAPVNVCERRIRERGVWAHSIGLSTSELARYVEHAEQAVAYAVQDARERGWAIVEIDNNDREREPVLLELREAIRRLLLSSANSLDCGEPT